MVKEVTNPEGGDQIQEVQTPKETAPVAEVEGVEANSEEEGQKRDKTPEEAGSEEPKPQDPPADAQPPKPVAWRVQTPPQRGFGRLMLAAFCGTMLGAGVTTLMMDRGATHMEDLINHMVELEDEFREEREKVRRFLNAANMASITGDEALTQRINELENDRINLGVQIAENRDLMEAYIEHGEAENAYVIHQLRKAQERDGVISEHVNGETAYIVHTLRGLLASLDKTLQNLKNLEDEMGKLETGIYKVVEQKLEDSEQEIQTLVTEMGNLVGESLKNVTDHVNGENAYHIQELKRIQSYLDDKRIYTASKDEATALIQRMDNGDNDVKRQLEETRTNLEKQMDELRSQLNGAITRISR